MKNEVIIKKGEKNHLKEILDLQKECFLPSAKFYGNLDIEPLTQTIEDLDKELEYKTILIAEIDGKIIGSVRAYSKNDTCYIGKLIVSPLHQNRGIGKLLMEEIESNFCGVDRYELYTGFLDDKNLYLYQKIGYKIYKYEEISKDFKFVFLEKNKVEIEEFNN